MIGRPRFWRFVVLAFVAPATALAGSLFAARGHADEIAVAAAANFLDPLKALAAPFERATGHRLKFSTGSTGELYTQIRNGAPFDVFLAADQERPALTETEGLAVAGTRFTYAIGRLVLWSADATMIGPDGGETLRTAAFRQLAIANPKTAPYGKAAVQALSRLGLYDALESKFVWGQSLSQAYQFVALGSAELGFIAASQLRPAEPSGQAPGSHWLVPEALYDPIRQDAVLLKHGAGNEGARTFLDFLKGSESRQIIKASGYHSANRP
ncbi:MAG: molybdate ABC transporter substrate-binding protein [Alphaproteobacteria bacterium]|nr:molybdate ABC transporter substrate-binding protein [Alphaproteobacteria bacterium]